MGGSERGLASPEAAARLDRWGPNELVPPRRGAALREIVHYLANPLVLLVASGVSATLGQAASAAIIALMLLLSLALNYGGPPRRPARRERLVKRWFYRRHPM